MSDSVWPHRQQPTRLSCPWDSPGKNTGVGCHFLLQYMKAKMENEVAQSRPTLRDPMDFSLLGSSVHGIFQAERTGVGCHCLLWFWNAVTYKGDILGKSSSDSSTNSTDKCCSLQTKMTSSLLFVPSTWTDLSQAFQLALPQPHSCSLPAWD